MRLTVASLAALALLAAALALLGYYLGERKMARVVRVPATWLTVPVDAARVEQGRYLFNTRGCATCHGADGAGREVIRSPGMLVVSPNISLGANSAVSAYTVQDWTRTLRHGVKPDGRPVMIMPSEDFARMPNEDVGALIAYIHTLAPVAGRVATVQLPAAVKVMYGFGMVRDAAELIDHSLAPALKIAPGMSLAHGAYVATICISCHGAGLSGGHIPGAPAEWPAPPNLTPGDGSVLPRYPTPAALKAMFQSGRRPDGTPISGVMPFDSLGQMNDTDVQAVHAYLNSLPPRAAGGR
jgi:mono/diheme cytochrome c family protein